MLVGVSVRGCVQGCVLVGVSVQGYVSARVCVSRCVSTMVCQCEGVCVLVGVSSVRGCVSARVCQRACTRVCQCKGVSVRGCAITLAIPVSVNRSSSSDLRFSLPSSSFSV